MKGLSKAISSPSRADKFPPPLIKFLRSNTGSRSRGRSRSSPLFRMRSRKGATPVIEPSSPKVTCFGQVQVRNSSSKPTNKASASASAAAAAVNNRPFRWLKFCCHSLRRRRRQDEESNPATQINQSQKICRNFEAQIEANKEDFVKGEFVAAASSPPKNALLLTRCRSAPYRSSSLARQFWGSSETETETETETDNDSKIQAKPENDLQHSVTNVVEGSTVHPLVLTRCKSEPAKTGERLNLWRATRLGVISPSSL